ncbi:putative LMBR1 domain protein [Aspergillus saccharolyticus JOP 1030-1]|uniref:Probable lysosomal cobalamin transporter n=1 Tax=Aspergillus saccharolyticus JOP 1030-1 TaxID=1450539 RepID=A0A319A3H8_9EURO|nr:putative lysosomal cobalamin transporter [Aspergillus saccharolyticus JOP 1030-1]PYH46688.1 putative lysosomal cobalamin transporter [Aspergillus saccharolyticus JOP 1030-1]
MASLQVSLIWFIYGTVIAVASLIAWCLVHFYQTPRDRSQVVTLTCILTIASLLATVLLLPVDVALVSSATSSTLGKRESWATQNVVDKDLSLLTGIYYLLYSLDAILCLLVIPFVYFWYEEYDEVASEAGEQTPVQRLWAAFKYAIPFVAIVAVLLLVGALAPLSKAEYDNEGVYSTYSLVDNRGRRALAFTIGVLMTIGVPSYILYTSAGLALLPIQALKALSASNDTWKAANAVQLESNRERQRQLDRRCGGNSGLLSSKDRRELDTLVREERTLIRRQRLAEEAHAEGRNWVVKLCLKANATCRPLRVIGGITLFLIASLISISMLLTAIDQTSSSLCKHHCGYLSKNLHIFNPMDQIFVQSAKIFPLDYLMFTIITLLLFCSSVFGIATIGIRFIWVRIYQVRSGHTSPQALLLLSAVLMLTILSMNYSLCMSVVSQYATFGSQTFCDRLPSLEGQSSCSDQKHLIKRCSDTANNIAAKRNCTPSVTSTFVNQIATQFPVFGVILFWSQYIFIGVYALVLVMSIVRPLKHDESSLDEEAEEAEEENLLASTRGRSDAGLNNVIRRMDMHNDSRSVRL